MTIYTVIFYVLAIVILVSTLLAITRRQTIHAVVYLIISFVSTGLLFYLLGAPFLAALEVIIYAGAIMVLFLFVVMTVKVESDGEAKEFYQWLPAAVLSLISFSVGGVLIFATQGSQEGLMARMATPAAFGLYLFKAYWFPVEIASFLLLIGLVGALYLGRQESTEEDKRSETKP
jgi:NADH-quinone oxidoreductase subunit J